MTVWCTWAYALQAHPLPMGVNSLLTGLVLIVCLRAWLLCMRLTITTSILGLRRSRQLPLDQVTRVDQRQDHDSERRPLPAVAED